MAKAKDRVADVKPYVQRAIQDEELRDNLRSACAWPQVVPERPEQVLVASARGARRERALERAWVETTRLRDVRDLQEDRGGLRRRIGHGRCRDPAGDLLEAHGLEVLPGLEVLRRVDCAVVAEVDQRRRMDLEVEVRRCAGRVAGVADEPEHLARLHAPAVPGQWREGREVRVVELVPLRVTEPESVAADRVPADGEDAPVAA